MSGCEWAAGNKNLDTNSKWRWLAQAQLMRDEFSKHLCLGQEWRRLLEAAKRTVSRSFLCLRFFVS